MIIREGRLHRYIQASLSLVQLQHYCALIGRELLSDIFIEVLCQLLSHKETAQVITIGGFHGRKELLIGQVGRISSWSPSLWHKRDGVATSRSNGPMLAWINLLLPGMLGLGSTRELLTLNLWDLLGLLLAVDTVRALQGLVRETKYRVIRPYGQILCIDTRSLKAQSRKNCLIWMCADDLVIAECCLKWEPHLSVSSGSSLSMISGLFPSPWLWLWGWGWGVKAW